MKIRILIIASMLVTKVVAFAQNGIVENNNAVNRIKELSMTSEWDKTFPKSDKVEHKKIKTIKF